jgi:sec-independent protein translocase protein TatB
MLDVAPTELLVVAVVALLVIGPKDLPRAMRVVGKWVGRARGVARQFRSGFDTMMREAELAELEKQWAAENERIMQQYPPHSLPAPDAPVSATEDAAPVMTPQPDLVPEPAAGPAPVEVRSRATRASAEASSESAAPASVADAPPPPAKPKRVRKPKVAPAAPAADEAKS